MKRNYGFSLIEMAIVVAIGATLLTLGLAALNSQSNSAGYSITKKRQDLIKDALIAHLGANKRFPCPYVPTIGSAATGKAPPQSGAPPACPQSFGTIPFATLGLAREIGEDGWGNLFSYQIYSDAPAPACPGPGRDWGNKLCFGAGKIGGLTIKDGAADLSSDLVAVVISHGANGLGAWVAAQGSRNANPVNCDEAHNAKIATVPGCALVANRYYKGESQANDDVVAYMIASDAILPLVKQGAINSAIAQVNTDLQILYDQKLGTKRAGISISGSPPAPTGCDTSVAGTSPPPFDPWGNPYVVAEDGLGGFPICICSGYSAAITSPTTCSIVPPTAICKSIDKSSFNSYLAKAGSSGC